MFDYNTRLVILCAGLLGIISGIVGVYLILRKRSLIGDAICHAALPGLVLAFLVQVALGGDGKNQYWLILGQILSGTAGACAILAVRRLTNLKEDAALGIVLSVSYGLAMALFSVATKLPSGNSAGLENFILGKTASMVASDAKMLAATALLVIVVLTMFRKELQLLCFDPSLAAAQGWPLLMMDLILLSCVLVVVIVGANIVGVILVIALLVIPPASARFWTHSFGYTILISGLIGAASGVFGSLSSFLVDRIPSGPAIVLSATLCFGISFVFGSKRGLLWQAWRIKVQRANTDLEHVIRAIYELLESRGLAPQPHGQLRSAPAALQDLVRMRSWSHRRLKSAVDNICHRGWATLNADGDAVLTASGIQQSMRAVRRHRLMELYFARWADLTPDAIDRGADYTEHVLDDDLLAQLEKDAMASGASIEVPKSLHPIGG